VAVVAVFTSTAQPQALEAQAVAERVAKVLLLPQEPQIQAVAVVAVVVHTLRREPVVLAAAAS
jgi:hypothetical protein